VAISSVVQEGSPVLSIPSVPVTEFGTLALKTLAADMLDTMIATRGVGIAAHQIGVNKRIILVGFEKNDRYPGYEPVPLQLVVNPVLEIIDPTLEKDWEGCLSVPGRQGLVPRHRGLVCKGFDPDGNPVRIEASGFHARIFQHECDHLDGRLFPSRVENDEFRPIQPVSEGAGNE